MAKAALAVVLITCVLVMLYLDSIRLPVGPSFNYSRKALTLIGSAGDDDKKKLDEAVSNLYESLRMDPNDPVALFGMAWALQKRGALKEASGYYDQSLKQIQELEKYIYYNRSLISESQGDKRRAISELSEALRVAPEYSDALNRKSALESQLIR